MRKICLHIFFIFTIVISVSLACNATSGLFVRDLFFGLSGSDVKELQILLNKDPETAVSHDGLGSAGQETSYFGAKTAAAVVKFQEKYANDILVSQGLMNGTGYVGSRTRAKLEYLATNSIITPIPSPLSTNLMTGITASSSANAANSFDNIAQLRTMLSNGAIPQEAIFRVLSPNDVMIFGLSHEKVKVGDQLSIVGYGFDPDSVVHIGPYISIPANAKTTNHIDIVIPSVVPGVYQVWISNKRGNTQNKTPLNVIVGNNTDVRPTILSVSPRNVKQGDIISVSVSNLDMTNNVIYSTLGIINNVSSNDGRTLSFKVSDLPRSALFFQNKTVNQFTVTFSIGTKSGKSLNYGYFFIKK